MFEQSFLSNAKTGKAKSLTMAVLLQSTLVSFVMVAPLIWPAVIPEIKASVILIAPPRPPAGPPAGAPGPHVAPKGTPRMKPKFFVPPVPTPNDKPQPKTDEPPDLAPGSDTPGPGGNHSGPSCAVPPCGNVPGGDSSGPPIVGVPPAVPPPPLPPARKEPEIPVPPQRVKVGGNAQKPVLIYRVEPPYPPLAKQAGIHGEIRFAAIISREGTIQQLRVVSGNPLLLVPSTIEAVRQWRYRPQFLNGDPIEVPTEIIVNFTLSR